MNDFIKLLGPRTAVIGAQWGDEGKGKIIDILAADYDIVARANGGANAGHTIVVNGKRSIFHLLPSGCLHPQTIVILGSGMVIHIETLLEEIRTLRETGIEVFNRLHISKAAHILTQEHKERDAKSEEQRKEAALGTTRRGIGPAYQDKAARIGKRMEDCKDNVLRHRVTDTVALLHEYLDAGKTILIEGAQGTLLDIDHGTYPYVTSSATTAAGALQGLGLPSGTLTSCVGVFKAYCTRVGGGPFPTEASEADANRLRERGGEYGATTGRPRRCGWLNLNDLKMAAKINGFTHLNLTKIDVLDEEAEIPILPAGAQRPALLPGWQETTKGLTNWSDLPQNAKNYIAFIEKEVGIPVAFTGTGPERGEMILRR